MKMFWSEDLRLYGSSIVKTQPIIAFIFAYNKIVCKSKELKPIFRYLIVLLFVNLMPFYGKAETENLNCIDLLTPGTNFKSRRDILNRGFHFSDLWVSDRKIVKVAIKIKKVSKFKIETSKYYDLLPQKMKKVIENGNIFTTASPGEVADSDFSALMITNSRGEGRTGILLYRDQPITIYVNGVERFVEFKGLGRPEGGFGQNYRRGFNIRIMGGHTLDMAKEEWSNHLNLDTLDDDGVKGAALIHFKSEFPHLDDQAVLIRLSPNLARTSYTAQSGQRIANLSTSVISRKLGTIIAQLLNRGFIPVTHVENFVVSPKGTIHITDYADLHDFRYFLRIDNQSVSYGLPILQWLLTNLISELDGGHDVVSNQKIFYKVLRDTLLENASLDQNTRSKLSEINLDSPEAALALGQVIFNQIVELKFYWQEKQHQFKVLPIIIDEDVLALNKIDRNKLKQYLTNGFDFELKKFSDENQNTRLDELSEFRSTQMANLYEKLDKLDRSTLMSIWTRTDILNAYQNWLMGIQVPKEHLIYINSAQCIARSHKKIIEHLGERIRFFTRVSQHLPSTEAKQAEKYAALLTQRQEWLKSLGPIDFFDTISDSPTFRISNYLLPVDLIR